MIIGCNNNQENSLLEGTWFYSKIHNDENGEWKAEVTLILKDGNFEQLGEIIPSTINVGTTSKKGTYFNKGNIMTMITTHIYNHNLLKWISKEEYIILLEEIWKEIGIIYEYDDRDLSPMFDDYICKYYISGNKLTFFDEYGSVTYLRKL